MYLLSWLRGEEGFWLQVRTSCQCSSNVSSTGEVKMLEEDGYGSQVEELVGTPCSVGIYIRGGAFQLVFLGYQMQR